MRDPLCSQCKTPCPCMLQLIHFEKSKKCIYLAEEKVCALGFEPDTEFFPSAQVKVEE